MDNPKPAVEEFNRHLKGQFPNIRSHHTKATVLCLYWEEDDLGCIREIEEIEKFFSSTLRYTVKRFAIPSRGSEIKLHQEIINLIIEHVEPGSLMIVYYGGHGLSDRENGRYGSVWAARNKADSPKLEWHAIQPSLLKSKADVLLILDCCHAAQAARGHTANLLAACSMGTGTPGVGKNSFTSNFLTQIKKLFRDEGCVSIPQLHRRLAGRSARTAETPFLVDLSDRKTTTPLILRPLTTVRTENTPAEQLCAMDFTCLIPESLAAVSQPEITDWLKTAPPMIKDLYCTDFEYHRPFESKPNTDETMGINLVVGSPMRNFKFAVPDLDLRPRKAYTKAFVLSLYWEDDDMGCIEEAKNINTLFEEDFGYQVQLFGIPSDRSQFALADKATKFLKENDGPNPLLIVYYGGHGDESDYRRSIWAA